MIRDLVIIVASFLPTQLLAQSPPTAAPAAQQAGAASSPAKSRPPTNRVSTPSSEHSLLAWTLADTPLSDNLPLGPDERPNRQSWFPYARMPHCLSEEGHTRPVCTGQL
jgi:hypothetical protein